MPNYGMVVVVEVARKGLKGEWYDDGLVHIVEECRTIIEAEKLAIEWAQKAPLPQGFEYEPFHKF